MASTRRQKSKGKSLCLTDFFSHSDSADDNSMDKVTTNSQPLSNQATHSSGDSLTDGDLIADLPATTSQPEAQHDPLPQRSNGLKRGSSAPVPTNPEEVESASVQYVDPSRGHSTSNSPVKLRAKLDTQVVAEIDAPIQPDDELGMFPTTDQAVSQTFLKDMMLALRASIHQSLTTTLSSQKAIIDEIGGRVDHVETKMAEFSEAHNGLVDAHSKLEDDFQTLSAKVADIEDRNRRNNIKIRGIPEAISNSELIPYIQQMMTTLLKPTSKRDLIIDRAHRLPKPKNIPAIVPRDVIMKVYFFHIKEALMRISRDTAQLPEPYKKLKFFADLSQFTIQARRNLQPVTAALRQHNVPYRWGFPTKLLIVKNGITHVISSVAESLPVFQRLDIPFSLPPPVIRQQQTTKVPSEWSVVRPPP